METRAIDPNLEADASRRKRSGALTPGETVTGWIAEVTGGDGLLVNVAGRGRFTVRLAYVDAPEFDQPGGREAKDALRRLAFEGRRGVGLRAVRDDRYGRTVAVVWSAGRTLNEELVRSGHAWVDPRFVGGATKRRYKALENEARRARRGVVSHFISSSFPELHRPVFSHRAGIIECNVMGPPSRQAATRPLRFAPALRVTQCPPHDKRLPWPQACFRPWADRLLHPGVPNCFVNRHDG